MEHAQWLDGMQWVTIAALIGAAVTLIVYVIQTVIVWRTPKDATLQKVSAVVDKASEAGGAAISLADATKLLEAFSKTIDSLAKAGPALTSLAASILFLGVGAISAGAFQPSPASQKQEQAADKQSNSATQPHRTPPKVSKDKKEGG
ncbi:MAG: hypothetical protein JOZ72_08540 [Alphaproteobacteria bacterium]|nr:hypothetical protein [Alphaproteobacteria bacterium]